MSVTVKELISFSFLVRGISELSGSFLPCLPGSSKLNSRIRHSSYRQPLGLPFSLLSTTILLTDLICLLAKPSHGLLEGKVVSSSKSVTSLWSVEATRDAGDKGCLSANPALSVTASGLTGKSLVTIWLDS